MLLPFRTNTTAAAPAAVILAAGLAFATLAVAQSTPPARPAPTPPAAAGRAPQVAPTAPQAGQAAPATPATPAAGSGHVLAGQWKVLWPTRNNAVNALSIDQAAGVPGGVTLSGRFAIDNGGACAMTGTVFDQFGAQIRDGLDTRTVSVAALVRMRVQCPGEEVWIEAFGLPAGPVLMSGRATRLRANQPPLHEVVLLGR